MFIDGIGIGGYRSFGELQRIGPFKKINLFIGKNNSGKSNILHFLTNQLPTFHKTISFGPVEPIKSDFQPDGFNTHRGKYSEFNFSIGISIDGPILKSFIQNLENQKTYSDSDIDSFKQFFERFTRNNNTYWIDFSPPFPTREFAKSLFNFYESNRFYQKPLWDFTQKFTGRRYLDEGIFALLTSIANHCIQHGKTNVDFIPAIREIGFSNSQKKDEGDFSGNGIIEELIKLQNPTAEEEKNKKRFKQINTFIQTLLGNKTAQIEIPYNRSTIKVHIDNKTLPIQNMGTGFHEATIIAAAATALTNQIICIEEPELHLHPLMEKELLRYLNEETDNQYFITTHSNNLINTPDAAVFHVQLENGQTTVTPAITDHQKFSICTDLGYKASDLLQANCIIWVEGPSDRIFLTHWISELDSKLKEGLHYSVMFYGGKLLSHLSADDPQVKEFISLRRINRNTSILIDSDKANPRARPNKTKVRIRDEFNNEDSGFAWVTQGREIENYIEPDLYEKAVKTVHPKAARIIHKGQFDNVFYYSTGRGEPKKADKVRVARELVKKPLNLNMLDLAEKIQRMVNFIKSANSMD